MRLVKNMKTVRLLGILLLWTAPLCYGETGDATPVGTVDALEKTFGIHPGDRRNHIKGTCASGTFVGSPEAGAYTRSPLFSGEPLGVVARFSLPGGNPRIPDYARVPRGMALEIRLPDGGRQHMTMLNTPMFGAATPQTFYDAVVAKRPDPLTGKPDPQKIKRFRETHPDSLPQAAYLAAHNPPVSWANSAYYGIHTFEFVNRENVTTPVRWRFVPRDGEKALSDEALKASPPNFLERRLVERVKRGPVRWDMLITIGGPDDPQNDPTVLWPRGRKELNIGTLTITAASPQNGGACENINYDPLVMTDGIAPSNDPVLLFRSPAYAVSYGRRISGR